jgi:hypothetical protein
MSLITELEQTVSLERREARRRAHVAICESKLRFETKQLAKRWCKRIISKGGDPRLRPYECRVCREFHLTTNRTY